MRIPAIVFFSIWALALHSAKVRAEGQLGDTAPALKIARWIKGEPVDLEKGKGKSVFVVEFWATWCPPCRTSIPRLTEIAKKYRDGGVVIIGVTNEADLDKVSSFVRDMGDKMDYVVAQDEEMKTFGLYMKAFDQGGIPHAFVVDKSGRIVWHGHPMASLDEVIGAVLAGTHDIEAAKTEARKAAEARQMVVSVREYFRLVKSTQDLSEKLLNDAKDNPMVLNQWAWMILTEEWIKNRDLGLAMKVAKAAYDASGGKDPAIVDTYARALFDTGKKQEAIEYQKKAIEMCTDDQLKADLRKTLERYEGAAHGVRL